MYNWRQMTDRQREETLRERQLRGLPQHGPPHFASDGLHRYHLTAACYMHRPILGHSSARMALFESEQERMCRMEGSNQVVVSLLLEKTAGHGHPEYPIPNVATVEWRTADGQMHRQEESRMLSPVPASALPGWPRRTRLLEDLT